MSTDSPSGLPSGGPSGRAGQPGPIGGYDTATRPVGNELSLFQLGTILLNNRWRILFWMMLFGGVSAVLTSMRPPRYESSASFIPQSSPPTAGALSSLAGQLGFAIPTESATESPEFYTQLLTSRGILLPIVLDTFAVPEEGTAPKTFLDLFEVSAESELVRQEDGLELLQTLVKPRRDVNTGTVFVSVSTRWPSVSEAIVTALIEGVHGFNQRTRQGQAAVERQFIEERLDLASTELRTSEDRLATFLSSNRLIDASPQLIFERERLQRDILLNQQVFTTLKQAHEEASIREVRAIPIITVLEAPTLPVSPEPRGRVKNTVLGLIIGGLIGALLALTREMYRRARRDGGDDVMALNAAVQDTRRQLFGWARRSGR